MESRMDSDRVSVELQRARLGSQTATSRLLNGSGSRPLSEHGSVPEIAIETETVWCYLEQGSIHWLTDCLWVEMRPKCWSILLRTAPHPPMPSISLFYLQISRLLSLKGLRTVERLVLKSWSVSPSQPIEPLLLVPFSIRKCTLESVLRQVHCLSTRPESAHRLLSLSLSLEGITSQLQRLSRSLSSLQLLHTSFSFANSSNTLSLNSSDTYLCPNLVKSLCFGNRLTIHPFPFDDFLLLRTRTTWHSWILQRYIPIYFYYSYFCSSSLPNSDRGDLFYFICSHSQLLARCVSTFKASWCQYHHSILTLTYICSWTRSSS